MQWLPTYMASNLGAEKHDIMFTAVPYIMNSLIGVGKSTFVYMYYRLKAAKNDKK